MIFHRNLEANLHVCQGCGHHMRIPLTRFEMLFDHGEFTQIDLPTAVQTLKFRDDKRYSDRLKERVARQVLVMRRSSRTVSSPVSKSFLRV